MNSEQAKVAVRWLVSNFGGLLVGLAVAKGIDAGTATAFLNSELFIGAAASIGMYVWGHLSRTKLGMILSASTIPELQQVTVTDPKLAKQVVDADADVKVVVK